MLLGLFAGAAAQAQSAAGRTAGEASVTATGTARYVIPLSLPPGTNGLAPALAVAYDSRGGHGLLGAGFRLEGFSTIQRCGSTLAQDGRLAAVALDAGDRYCLDGQRLRLAAGTYGQPGSEYRTEVETFARVTATGVAGAGPASFRVERRDGLVYEYGTTDDSRIESLGSTTPRAWAVSRILDRAGNFIEFRYTEDGAGGAYRPTRIDYAGNIRTGALPYYSVRFTYEARPADDQPAGFVGGGAVRESQRLDRIDIVHVATLANARSYDLGYDNIGATGRSRLVRLQECARSACLPPTRFDWSASQPGWGGNTTLPLASDRYATAIPGDMDGDGFEDLAYFDASSRGWRVQHGGPNGFASVAVDTRAGDGSESSRAIGADFDGDGRREVLVPQGGYWHWLRRTGAGAYTYGSSGVTAPANGATALAADVDGDGRDDLVFRSASGDALRWRRSVSVAGTPAFDAEATLWQAPAGTALPAAPFVQAVQRLRSAERSADFNDDGRMDLLVRTVPSSCVATSNCTSPARWQVLVSTGSALVAQAALDGVTDILLADLNGDRLTDIVYLAPGSAWQVLHGAGSRSPALAAFAGPSMTSVPVPTVAGASVITDWNGDGRDDLVQFGAAGDATACRSDGMVFGNCQPTLVPLSVAPTGPAVLDANGDGLQDLVIVASGSVRLLAHHSSAPDLLVAATDGLGAVSTFAYAPATDRSVHVLGTTAAFPVRDDARPWRVVSSAAMVQGQGLRRESYFYEGARWHAQGRGFLGFARRTAHDQDGGLTRVEDYLQDPLAYDRIGALSLLTLKQRTRGPVSITGYNWSRRAFGSGYEGRSFPFVASATTDRYELDGMQVLRIAEYNTFDAFGTLVRRQVNTSEIGKGLTPGALYTEVTTLGGVINDTQNWCLGRPASAQVSRQHNLATGAQLMRTEAYSWDLAACRMAQSVVEPSSTTLRVATDLAYDSYGNESSVTLTPVGQPVRVTTLNWGADGRFLRDTTNAEGHVVRTAWDAALARPVSVTDANGLVTAVQHDEFGRETRTTRPDGTGVVTVRTMCGSDCAWPEARLVVNQSARGAGDLQLAFVETGYDQYGREVHVRADQPGGAQVLSARRFDARGLVTQQSAPSACCASPAYWTTVAYDVLGRPVREEQPASPGRPVPAVTSWRHDGLTVTETDPLGRSTIRKHTVAGEVAQVVDPALADTTYAYDAFGNLVRVRDALGSETRAAFDVLGRRTTLLDSSAGLWLYAYYPLGELKSQVNGRGQGTTLTYDRLSRVLTRVEQEGVTTWTWGNSPADRNVGSLVSVQGPNVSERFTYDTLGRSATAVRQVQGASLAVAYTYDPVTGLRDTMSYPTSGSVAPLRVRHRYDRQRLVEVADADTGASFWRLESADPRGHAAAELLGNGVQIASSYDPATGLLTQRTAGPGGGSSHQNLAFEWDAAGNLARRTERNAGVEETFAYDAVNRLDHVQRGGVPALDLAYDAVGNLTYKSDVGQYRYDAARGNALVSAGTNTYSYDANGAVANASGTTIVWQSFNLPSRIMHPAGNYSLFEYAPDRSRARQLAIAGGASTDTLYAAGGLYERVASGSTIKHRNYIVADGRRVAVQTRTAGAEPETVYLLEDQLGGVDGFTSASGSLLTRTSYQPFGAHRSGNWLGSTPTAAEWQQIQRTTPRGYTGHEHLNNLGVIHMNGRVYDPVLGRFLSPDPVVQAPHDTQGFNRYAYVRNNPLRYTDPSGFCYQTLHRVPVGSRSASRKSPSELRDKCRSGR